MTKDILLKSISQGNRGTVAVFTRTEKLCLGRPREVTPQQLVASGNSTTATAMASAEVSYIPADEAVSTFNKELQRTAAPIPLTTNSEAVAVENNRACTFDFELLERLKNCSPALILLKTEEVAAIFRVTVKKLENDRYRKRGLKYIKTVGSVRYRLSDILKELDNAS